MDKYIRIKKAPVRSVMSDKELAEIIRRDREERPMEFEDSCSTGVNDVSHFAKIPSVTQVIAKWL